MILFFSDMNRPLWFDPNKQVIFDPTERDDEWSSNIWDQFEPFTLRKP